MARRMYEENQLGGGSADDYILITDYPVATSQDFRVLIPAGYKPVACLNDDNFNTPFPLTPSLTSWQVTNSGDEIAYSVSGNYAILTWTYQGGQPSGGPTFAVLCKKI